MKTIRVSHHLMQHVAVGLNDSLGLTRGTRCIENPRQRIR